MTASAFLAAVNRRIASIPSATLSITMGPDATGEQQFTVTAQATATGQPFASLRLGSRALRRAVEEQTLERMIDRLIDELASHVPRQSTQQTVKP